MNLANDMKKNNKILIHKGIVDDHAYSFSSRSHVNLYIELRKWEEVILIQKSNVYRLYRHVSIKLFTYLVELLT